MPHPSLHPSTERSGSSGPTLLQLPCAAPQWPWLDRLVVQDATTDFQRRWARLQAGQGCRERQRGVNGCVLPELIPVRLADMATTIRLTSCTIPQQVFSRVNIATVENNKTNAEQNNIAETICSGSCVPPQQPSQARLGKRLQLQRSLPHTRCPSEPQY